MSVTSRYYNQKASTYDSQQNLLYFKVYDLITWKYTKPFIPKKSATRVLDAAGGTAKWSIPIALEGPQVVLVDLSDGMLEVARRKITDAGLNGRIDVCKGDITSLDFEDQTFDMVFCDHALCFAKDVTTVVKELVRVLKRGSPLVISAQNRYPLGLSIVSENFETGIKVLLGKEPFFMRGQVPVRTLFPEDFRNMLETNGIRIAKMIGKGIAVTPLVMPTERFWTDNYDQSFLSELTNVELSLCERQDALPLAGHIQAVGHRTLPRTLP